MGDGTSRRKGGRRAYLRRYSSSVVGTSSSTDKHYFREQAQRCHALNHKDIAFMRLFGLDDPSAADDRARTHNGLQPRLSHSTPRDIVLKQLSELTQQVNPDNHICLIPRELFLLWDDHKYYFLVKYDRKTETVKRSIRYPDRDRLMTAWQTRTVYWK